MKKKILIIDDDIVTLAVISSRLVKYDITTAKSGEEALELLKSNRPDLIVLDVCMQGMDGYELCKIIRKIKSADELPIIFLSGKSTLADKVKGYEAGGNDFLIKPYDVHVLQEKISKTIKSSRQALTYKEQLNQFNEASSYIQNNAARLRDIAVFSQYSSLCETIEELCKQFLVVTNNASINCIIRVSLNDQTYVQSYNNVVSQIELDLLTLAREEEKVFHFGQNRVIFNWEYTSLLVKNFCEDQVDILAILLDSFESGLKTCTAEVNLIDAVNKSQTKNAELQAKVIDLYTNMIADIQAKYKSSDNDIALTANQEHILTTENNERIGKINQLFAQTQQHEKNVSDLVEKRHSIKQQAIDNQISGTEYF